MFLSEFKHLDKFRIMAPDGTFAVSFRITLFINLTSGLLFLKFINISFSFAPTLQGSDSEFQTDPL